MNGKSTLQFYKLMILEWGQELYTNIPKFKKKKSLQGFLSVNHEF
jgi:hypothetical protein